MGDPHRGTLEADSHHPPAASGGSAQTGHSFGPTAPATLPSPQGRPPVGSWSLLSIGGGARGSPAHSTFPLWSSVPSRHPGLDGGCKTIHTSVGPPQSLALCSFKGHSSPPRAGDFLPQRSLGWVSTFRRTPCKLQASLPSLWVHYLLCNGRVLTSRGYHYFEKSSGSVRGETATMATVDRVSGLRC